MYSQQMEYETVLYHSHGLSYGRYSEESGIKKGTCYEIKVFLHRHERAVQQRGLAIDSGELLPLQLLSCLNFAHNCSYPYIS